MTEQPRIYFRMPFGIQNALNNKIKLMMALTWRKVYSLGIRVFANSIPKSGTHLLSRCLNLLPGMTNSGLHINNHKSQMNMLKYLGGNCFVTAHLYFSFDRVIKLNQYQYKHLLMIRDPRDIIISQFHFIKKRPNARCFNYFDSLPDDNARIMALIQGIPYSETSDRIQLLNIGMHISQYLMWIKKGSYLVRFENLIGEAGGGSKINQLAEVKKLAKYLGFDFSNNEAEQISNQVFSRQSKTFRKGEIGDWKTSFTDEHKKELKKHIGQILIDLDYEKDFDW